MTERARSFDALRIGDNSIAETFEGNQGFVESIRLRERSVVHITTAAHMPFAEMSGRVACCFQLLRGRRGGRIEVVSHAAIRVASPTIQERMDSPTSLILSGGEGHS